MELSTPPSGEWFPRPRGDRPLSGQAMIETGWRYGFPRPRGDRPSYMTVDIDVHPGRRFPRPRGDRPLEYQCLSTSAQARFPRPRGDRPLLQGVRTALAIGVGSPAHAGIDPSGGAGVADLGALGSPAHAGIDPEYSLIGDKLPSWGGFPRPRGDRPRFSRRPTLST